MKVDRPHSRVGRDFPAFGVIVFASDRFSEQRRQFTKTGLEAIEETTVIEVKSPAQPLEQFLGT
ncbi:MAG: hypothetical protein IH956_07670 [Chloroflexi bacterium]|nr:hypothetical protein [Chloroflexota bacterium]